MNKLAMILITFFYLGSASASLNCVSMESNSSDAVINNAKIAANYAIQQKGIRRIESTRYCGSFKTVFGGVRGQVFEINSLQVIVYEKAFNRQGDKAQDFNINDHKDLGINLEDL